VSDSHMKLYKIRATWRSPIKTRDGIPIPAFGRDHSLAPTIVLVSGITLADPIADIMRFSLLGSGLIVLGDAMTVLHMDIGLASMAIEGRHGDALMIGLLQRRSDGWVARTQPHGTVPIALFPRLDTWRELVGDVEVTIFDDYGDDGSGAWS